MHTAAGGGIGIGFTAGIHRCDRCGAMYFLAIRPQKKEQKRLNAMLAELAVGDSVVTTSGFYGVVIDITDEDVIVEFGSNKNCRIPMKKSCNFSEVEKARMQNNSENAVKRTTDHPASFFCCVTVTCYMEDSKK